MIVLFYFISLLNSQGRIHIIKSHLHRREGIKVHTLNALDAESFAFNAQNRQDQ